MHIPPVDVKAIIRKRASYLEWTHLYRVFKEGINVEEWLNVIYETIDHHRGFRSQQNADYAKQSLLQVLEDVDSGFASPVNTVKTLEKQPDTIILDAMFRVLQ